MLYNKMLLFTNPFTNRPIPVLDTVQLKGTFKNHL